MTIAHMAIRPGELINKFIIDRIVSEREILLNKNLIMPFSFSIL
jgi:hypothetical protein